MTRTYYPDDAVSRLIDEVRGKFSHYAIDNSSAAGSYTKLMASDVLSLRDKYEDLSKVDSLAAANARIDEAKGIATDSIH